jgi:hypothetical protein
MPEVPYLPVVTTPEELKLLQEWWKTLTSKEQTLHILASVELKKRLPLQDDNDSGSYDPRTCHAFKKWLKR